MRRSGLAELGATLREAGIRWFTDRCLLHGSALAFGAVFALAPLFVIVIEIANHLAEHRIVERVFIGQVEHSVGPQAGNALDSMIIASRHNAEAGFLASPLAWALLVGTAVGVFFTVLPCGNTREIKDAPPCPPCSDRFPFDAPLPT